MRLARRKEQQPFHTATKQQRFGSRFGNFIRWYVGCFAAACVPTGRLLCLGATYPAAVAPPHASQPTGRKQLAGQRFAMPQRIRGAWSWPTVGAANADGAIPAQPAPRDTDAHLATTGHYQNEAERWIRPTGTIKFSPPQPPTANVIHLTLAAVRRNDSIVGSRQKSVAANPTSALIQGGFFQNTGTAAR